ncbi:MAG: hypothetical protein ACKVPJ_09280 [Chitinophagales bacterium]
MKEQEFEKQMENLKTPQIDDIKHQQILKITLLNARKSSQVGILFIIIPCLFLLGVFIKYLLGIDFGLFTAIEDKMAIFDKTSSLKWIAPLLLVGLPLISIIINSLAVMHFYLDSNKRELIITIKYRLLNIILLLISMGIVAVFFLYAITDNEPTLIQ